MVRNIDRYSEEDEEEEVDYLFLGSITDGEINSIDTMSWEIHMPAKEGAIRFKVDSGADVTVIPKEELFKLG